MATIEPSELIVSAISGNLLSTGLTFITLLSIYFLGAFVLKKRIDDERHYQRAKARLYYTLAGLFVFFLTKVWVEGFSHFFTILGVVSAALVITNKELIMNLVGRLIINWRSLFTEHDYIQIANHAGYVHELGLLYFQIYEGSKNDINLCTGKVIKVPNGLVIHNPIVNYSEKNNLMEYTMHWILTYDSQYKKFVDKLQDIVSTVLTAYYQLNTKYTMDYLKKRNRYLASHIQLDPHTHVKIHQSTPHGIEICVYFYCYPIDSGVISEKINVAVIDYLQGEVEISPAADS